MESDLREMCASHESIGRLTVATAREIYPSSGFSNGAQFVWVSRPLFAHPARRALGLDKFGGPSQTRPPS